jgi:hypothetical protein
VSHEVNNQILNLAHLTQVAHPHHVTHTPFTQGNTTASGNPGNIAGTSTSHPGNTSGNVIYVDANLPYTGVFRWEIRIAFQLLIYLTQGVCPLWVTRGFLLTPHRPTQTQIFSNVLPNHVLRSQHTPTDMGVPHGPIPDMFFPRTPAYATPNAWVGDNEGVRDQFARTLWEFVFTLRARARL